MKKKILMLGLLCVCICSNIQSAKKIIDTQLVGTWWGSEKDEQMAGVTVKWIQQRYSDGSLVTTFTNMYGFGIQDTSVEKGKWWIEDGKFFEKSGKRKKADIYYYEVIDKDHILFKAYKLSTDFENKNYNFIDTRVENDSLFIPEKK